MTAHRRAPYVEWVEMYRRGLTSTKIAEVARAPVTTVRYHLRLAAAAEPQLREEHKGAQRPVRKIGRAGLNNLTAIVSLFHSEDRLPSSKAADPRERALAVWLLRRRQDRDSDILAPEYQEGLRAVTGWDERTRKTKDEAQWEARMQALSAYRAAGNDWPRHKSTDSEEERLLGVWLQYQRTKLADGKLDVDKQERLDEGMPGWRHGRTKGRKQRLI